MKWFLGILVVIIIALGAWYLWSDSNSPAVQTTGSTATTTQQAEIIPGTSNETYTSQRLSFSIQYPSTASTTADFSSGFLPLTGTPVIGITLPSSMFSGTNLAEAGVFIGATTTPSVMTACTDLSQIQPGDATSTAIIGGQQFVEIDSTDAAAGNLYQQKTYRAFQNGSCLEIVELLHSGNINNYPSGAVQPFDQSEFSGLLNSIVQTYYPIPTGE